MVDKKDKQLMEKDNQNLSLINSIAELEK